MDDQTALQIIWVICGALAFAIGCVTHYWSFGKVRASDYYAYAFFGFVGGVPALPAIILAAVVWHFWGPYQNNR